MRKKSNDGYKKEMSERERWANKIFEDCDIELPYLTWAMTPVADLKAFYEENKGREGELTKVY